MYSFPIGNLPYFPCLFISHRYIKALIPLLTLAFISPALSAYSSALLFHPPALTTLLSPSLLLLLQHTLLFYSKCSLRNPLLVLFPHLHTRR
ncbi:hypothetical protein QBC41DRAFT_319799 [Cercophora samala]|uniref:Uncharacterized protein n=1 Tax=Cercophora samala TaxID=330535 RepID=A0AA39ZEJ3_9PEZI|nr:hypothetical protein QBC41DRAFT_319799 [Cercophora samala]